MINNKPEYILKEVQYTILHKEFYKAIDNYRMQEVNLDNKNTNYDKIRSKIARKKALIEHIRGNQDREKNTMGKTNTTVKNILINLNCHRSKYSLYEQLFFNELSFTINHELFHIILKAEHNNRTSNQLHNILHILKPYGVY